MSRSIWYGLMAALLMLGLVLGVVVNFTTGLLVVPVLIGLLLLGLFAGLVAKAQESSTYEMPESAQTPDSVHKRSD